MQCTSCGTTLQPGVTTCPSCGAAVPADTSDSSPYESYADTVPYIPYAPSEERASTSANSPSSETPVLHQSLYGPSPLAASSTPASSPSSETPAPQQNLYGPSPLAASSTPQNLVAQPQPLLTTQPVPKPRRGLSASVTALFIILALLLIGSGGGLTYYVTVFHPAELHAQATAVAQNVLAEATAQAATISPQQLYAQVTSSKPTITDPLNNLGSSIWIATPSCTLTGGAYHASESTKSRAALCVAPATDFQDVAFQVQMTILKGDVGGLMFHTILDASNQIQSYFFGIDPTGSYHFLSSSQAGIGPLREGTSPAVITGLNQPNLITVIARGNKFYLYVNKQFVIVVSNNTYASGGVGLFVADLGNPTDVMFSNAQVWAL